VSHYPSAEFLTSAAHSSQFLPDEGAEVAFAGRSNSGKSSAINSIVGRRALARVSKTPGRTRLLNFFRLSEGRRIVDLPGYGYAEASAAERATWAPMTTALAKRSSLRGLFLIVDSRRGLLPGDQVLLDWAAGAARPVHVLLSKADKLKRTELIRALAGTRAALTGVATVQAFSAVTGDGVEEARARLDQWLASGAHP
jgi:GTP-binding protein